MTKWDRVVVPIVDLFSRSPPEDPEAELALIGSCILRPSVMPDVLALVRSDSFTSDRNRAIWTAMLSMYLSDRTIDMTILCGKLKDAGADESDYLVRAAESVPSPVNAPHYAKRVAGIARAREAIVAMAKAVHGIYDNPAVADAIVLEALGELQAVTDNRVPRIDVTLGEASRAVVEALRSGEGAPMTTGVRQLDRICGIPSSGLATIIGLPGSGKSTVASNLALRWAMAGIPVRVFSFEQPSRKIAETVLSTQTGIDIRGAMRERRPLRPSDMDEVAAQAEANRSIPLEFVDELLDARAIEARCDLYARSGVRVVVVDYLQNLPMLRDSRDQYQSIAESAAAMQRIARRHEMLVVMLCQVDKEAARNAGTEKPVRLSDAYGGAKISMVSDFAMTVHRPWQFDPSEDVTRMMLAVTKNKYGPIGVAETTFQPETGMVGESPLTNTKQEPIYEPSDTLPI